MLSRRTRTFCLTHLWVGIAFIACVGLTVSCQPLPSPMDEMAKSVDSKISNIVVPESAPAFADGSSKVPVYFYAKDSGGNPIKNFKPELGVIGAGENKIHCEPSGAEYADCSLTSNQGGPKIIYSKNVRMLKSARAFFFENPLLGKMLVKRHMVPANGFATAIIEVHLKNSKGLPRYGLRPQLYFEKGNAGKVHCSITSEAGISICRVTANEPGLYVLGSNNPTLPSVEVQFEESRMRVVNARAYAGRSDSFVRLIVKGNELPRFQIQPNDVEVACSRMTHGESACKLSSKAGGTKLLRLDSGGGEEETLAIDFVDDKKYLRYFSEQAAIADGFSKVEVEIQLKDSSNAPLKIQSPELDIIGTGINHWTCGSGNAEGKVKCQISSTEPGIKIVEVRDPAVKDSVEIEFAQSPIVLKTNSQAADGFSPVVLELISQSPEGTIPFLDVRGPSESDPKYRCLPYKKYSTKDEVRSLCFVWTMVPGVYKVTDRHSNRGQVEVTFTDPFGSFELKNGENATAKADGVEKIKFQIMAKNEWGAPRFGAVPVLEVLPPLGITSHCSVIGFDGASDCEIQSLRTGSFRVKAQDPAIAGHYNVLFRSPHGGISENSPSLGIVNSTEAIANTSSKAIVHINLKDNSGNPLMGVLPRIVVEGEGINVGTCYPSDINGVGRCDIASSEVGPKTIRVEEPPIDQSIKVVFREKSRVCKAENAAETIQDWEGPAFEDWSSCRILRCNENYRLDANVCIALVKECDPLPLGARQGTQTWNSRHGDRTWGDCKISKCLPHYQLQNSSGDEADACVPEVRDCPKVEIPKQFVAGLQTWNGKNWGDCKPSACRYPNKVSGEECLTADVTPSFKGELEDIAEAIPGEEYKSKSLVISDIERNVPFQLIGGIDSYIEIKDHDEWVKKGVSVFADQLGHLHEGLHSGDEIRLVSKSSSELGMKTKLTLTVGSASPLEWFLETLPETPPPNPLLNHAPGQRSFQVSWEEGGVGGGGPNNCQVQFFNGKAWMAVGKSFDCDHRQVPESISLPEDGWVSDFSATGIMVRMIRLTDQAVVVNFANKLTCVPDAIMPGKNDPDKDENCNGRWNDEDDNLPPEKGDFTIIPAEGSDVGITGTASVNLKINCPTDQSGEVQVAFGASAEPTNWSPCVSDKPHHLGSGHGTKKVYLRFKDRYSNTTKDLVRDIVLDQEAPVGGQLTIEGAARAIKSNKVLLAIQCPQDSSEKVERAIGESPEPTEWRNCRSEEVFELSKGEGTKSIYIRFRDRFGNISEALKSEVIVDSSGPIAHLNVKSGWVNALPHEIHVDVRDELESLPLKCSIEAQEKVADTGETLGTAYGPLLEISQSCEKAVYSLQHGKVYRFRVKASDSLGNLGSYSALSSEVRVDAEVPTLTNISATTHRSQPGCEVVRVSINGGSDAMSGLAEKAYSFDGGKTWQASYYKDFETTSLVLPSGQLRLRDAAGNIYIYEAAVSGSAEACRHDATN